MPDKYRVEKWTGETEPTVRDLRRVLEAEGFSVFQWSDPPGAYYPPHTHNDEQSHWIVSGMLELNVAGQGTFVLSSGDRDFMPANTEHEASVLGREPVVILIGAKR